MVSSVPGKAERKPAKDNCGQFAQPARGALDAGRSVDTTMGFTALDGLMMGTRCGSLDPGVVFHLLARKSGV